MNQKVIIGIGVLLLIVIVVQSVFLFRLSGQVNQINQNTTTIDQSLDKSFSSPMLPPGGSLFSPKDNDWDPFEEMQRMQNEMNRIFGDMRSQLHQSPGFDDQAKSFSFSPSMDVKEDDDRVVVTVDIPGSDESNINVKVDGQRLTISANTKKTTEKKDKAHIFRSERFIGQFERSITLPVPVVAEKMRREYKDGVLTIILPKA